MGKEGVEGGVGTEGVGTEGVGRVCKHELEGLDSYHY